MKGTKEVTFCDHCGEEVDPDNSTETFWVSELPVDIDSANAGESAVLCKLCYESEVEPYEEDHPHFSGESIEVQGSDWYSVGGYTLG
jgi:hypothetical protein